MYEETDIVVCGCGPTGALLANYLGQMGVNCIVLEREPDIVTDPRGIVLDDEGIRYLQGVGIYDEVFSEIGDVMERSIFISGDTTDLMKAPFAVTRYATEEGGMGQPGKMCHKQPILEEKLRKALSQYETVELRGSCTVCDISEQDDHVLVGYKNKNGESHTVKAKYIASSDGKTGFTRKQYLEPRGVILEHTTPRYEATWVATNWKLTLPTPETHPHFPLWEKGYTPDQVYDLFFPIDFRFLSNPKRPSVCGRFGKKADRLWRFEYVIFDGERDKTSIDDMKKIVFPYITHPGSKYGLAQESICFPEDCIEVLRCRPFCFSARNCNVWSQGRTIILGDAAHVFPPFGGQGIASGFRDAMALAWRLCVASRDDFKHDPEFFTTWWKERKQQLSKSLKSTVRNGEYVTKMGGIVSWMYEWRYWASQLTPSYRCYLEHGARNITMTKYNYEPGFWFIDSDYCGTLFPQVYCIRLNGSSQVGFTDDIIFGKGRNLFQLVVLVSDGSEIDSIHNNLPDVEALSKGEIAKSEITYLVLDLNCNLVTTHNAARIASAQEFSNSKLCKNRPEPAYYDPHRIQKEMGNNRYVIIRHDKFTFAVCNDSNQLQYSLTSLANLLHSA